MKPITNCAQDKNFISSSHELNLAVMSWTTWQCRDNSTFKASACFDSIIFKGKGGCQGKVTDGRSIVEKKTQKPNKQRKQKQKEEK